MTTPVDRRSFLRMAGLSLGAGALYRVAPALARGREGEGLSRQLARANGEAPAPFLFVQLSDEHVGFQGPPDPLGTKAFEKAAALIDGLPARPEMILFTGDLTHDSEKHDERVRRFRRFKEIADRIRVPVKHLIPGEHDAAQDGGALFRELVGETTYSFDHRGVHFVALDNVSRPKPEIGPERLAWLARDLERFPKTTPIVVFTHRPLFDLRPDWEWFTSDGDKAMALLAPYQNVTVLYGHIHREDVHDDGHARHYAARSLIFAFNDPSQPAKKPLPFDPAHPFKNLGVRLVHAGRAGAAGVSLGLEEVELTMREHSGTEGFQQLIKAVPA